MMRHNDLIERLITGDTRSVARAISIVERGGDAAASLMKEIFPKTGNAMVIGVTGSPGAGKSSLVDKLALHYTQQDEQTRRVPVVIVSMMVCLSPP